MKPLTRREIEVQTLMLTGIKNRDIAEKLGVKIHTVKFHLTNIYKKLGLKGRVDCIVDDIVETYKEGGPLPKGQA